MTTKLNKTIEIWRQDNETQDLWHNENNLIINTAALLERESYFEIVRIASDSIIHLKHSSLGSDSPPVY